eukprot:14667494-Alexandrium_andersonii.AAC.1
MRSSLRATVLRPRLPDPTRPAGPSPFLCLSYPSVVQVPDPSGRWPCARSGVRAPQRAGPLGSRDLR